MKHHFRTIFALCMITVLMTAALVACGGNTCEIAEAGLWTDGIYTATAEGRNGDFEVTVTIEDGKMLSVEVGDNEETEDKGGVAIEALLPEFVSEQTCEVDAISGATVTSRALKNAIAQCLKAASQEALAEEEE